MLLALSFGLHQLCSNVQLWPHGGSIGQAILTTATLRKDSDYLFIPMEITSY